MNENHTEHPYGSPEYGRPAEAAGPSAEPTQPIQSSQPVEPEPPGQGYVDHTTPLPTLTPPGAAPQPSQGASYPAPAGQYAHAAQHPQASQYPHASQYPQASQGNPYQRPAQGSPTQPGHALNTQQGYYEAPGHRARSRVGAGTLVLALLAGGAGGFGGAAAWGLLGDDGTTGTAAPVTAPARTAHPAPVVADGSVESVASTVLPSVVQIIVRGSQGSGSGSGIILTADGRILTNNHVVELAGKDGDLSVAFNDGRKAKATIVGTDPKTDSAVIQVEGIKGLTPATIGDSGALQVGAQVVAIGSPYGLDATVTTGIVSALNRPVSVSTDAVYPAIQTDAAINPGNSGGPLVNMDGQVVGVNSSIRGVQSASGEAGSIGLGFAIPINELMPIVDQIVAGETPTHARFGITVGDAADDAAAAGAVVGDVTPVSAADKAGLRSGDVITKVDDHRITGSESLVATVRSYRPGDRVTVTYVRGSHTDTATVTLDSDGQEG